MTLASEVLARRLSVVRYLYELGQQQSRQAGFRRASAILSFHDAVEMLVVLGLQHHDVYKSKKFYQFAEYWTELETAGIHITQQGTMEALSRLRANLKHHAMLPASEEVEAARVHVRDFFVENTPIIFGENFDEISLVGIVQNESARTRLVSAEEAMRRSDYLQGAGDLAIALQILIDTASREPFYHGLNALRFWNLSGRGLSGGDAVSNYLARELEKFTREVDRIVDALSDRLDLLSVGLDPRRHARFRALTPHVLRQGQGQYALSEWPHDDQPNLEGYRFCLEFVIESALRLQDQS